MNTAQFTARNGNITLNVRQIRDFWWYQSSLDSKAKMYGPFGQLQNILDLFPDAIKISGTF